MEVPADEIGCGNAEGRGAVFFGVNVVPTLEEQLCLSRLFGWNPGYTYNHIFSVPFVFVADDQFGPFHCSKEVLGVYPRRIGPEFIPQLRAPSRGRNTTDIVPTTAHQLSPSQS